MAKSSSTPSSEMTTLPSIRTTVENKLLVQDKAKQAHLSVSDYMLRCALHRPIPARPSEVNLQAYAQLAQLNMGMRQLVSHLEDLKQNPLRFSEDIQAMLMAIMDRIYQQEQWVAEIRGLLLYGEDNLTDEE